MHDPDQKTSRFRLRRPLILALVGLTTVAMGSGVGLWLNPPAPDNGEGKHSTAWENPQGIPLTDRLPVPGEVPSQLTQSELNQVTMPADADEAATETDRITDYVRNGDDALRTGNYSRAISIYRSLLPHTEGAHEASVRYRLALSSECANACKEALRQYQAIAQQFPQSTWNDVAQLGRIRCLALESETGTLDTVVYRAILDNTVLTPPVRREVLHVAARGLSGVLLNPRRDDILNPQTLLLAAWHIEPSLELARLPSLLETDPVPPGESTFEVLQDFNDNPDDIYFRIYSRRASLRTLLTRMAEQTGLGLRLSRNAMEAMASRKHAIHAEDISMSLLLDGLCVPLGLSWHQQDSTVIVSASEDRTDEEKADYLFQRAERLLDTARIDATDSPQSGHTKIAHGCLLFEKGRTADAAHLFADLLQSGDRPELDIETSFNLGKCYQSLGQLAEAEQTWYRCVDTGGRDRFTRTAAFLCLSRLQLEDARFQKAASSLAMAVDLSAGSPLEQQATALLGSAYLMAGNAPAANTAMFEHRGAIEDETVRQTVAFVAALARYHSAGLSKRQQIEAQDVVATLTHFDPSAAFGDHWHVLAAQACDELGLAEPAVAHYAQAVQSLNDGGLRQVAMLRLAERYRDDDRLQDAGKILQAAAVKDTSPLTHEIELQKADLTLRQGNTQATIELCHPIAVGAAEQSIRRRALKLMGRAFEKQGDHESAVYCFAGMLPRSLTSQAVRPTGHEEIK